MKRPISISKIFLLLLISFFPMFLAAQSVTFTSSNVEYDVEVDGQMGMYFHFDFTVHGCLGKNLSADLFLIDSKNKWVPANDDNYKSLEGYVCKSLSITATYENSHWKDLKLFIPYTAMPKAESGLTYTYTLALRYENGSDLQQSPFWPVDWPAYSPSAKFDKIWVDHNQMKDNEKGMLIHAYVHVYNLKGSKVQFSCFFYDSDGKNVIVPNASNDYKTTSDQLLTYKTLVPTASRSYWDDLQLFIPNSQFPSIPGSTNYTFKIKVRDVSRDYDVLAVSDSYSFKITNSQNNGEKPTIEWLAAYESTSTSFLVSAGIRSKSEITQSSVTVNGTAYRGMKTVKNDGYQMHLNENVTLREGTNNIVVSATNSSGTTTRTFQVKCTPPSHDIVANDKRVALVIGNAAYPNDPLSNPVNDAIDISASLRRLGFDVVTLTNCTKRQMDEAISDLGRRSSANTVSLFYYAGHGIQKDGRNFLIPVDAVMYGASDIEYACTDVNRVLDNLEDSGCLMNIIVLDACRNNPFERSWNRGAGSRGLSTPNAPRGTVIAYATAPGDVALDGKGRNSPYTEAFLQALQTPGLGIYDFLQEVQERVEEKTNQSQTPWFAGSFKGKFYFNP